MSKVILLSHFPLPYAKIGSWTTLYKNYLLGDHQIDSIICPKPEKTFKNVHYQFIKNDITSGWRRKLNIFPFRQVLKPLSKLINGSDKQLLQIVDNSGIVVPLNNFLVKKNLRKNSYIQYFYHGFPPLFDLDIGRNFLESIDEIVFLTHDSYKAHIEYYGDLPCAHSIMHNGIDTKKFVKLSEKNKEAMKAGLGFSAKQIFIWCAQDRPKKGLDIVLKTWEKLYENRKDEILLLVIGAQDRESMNGVVFLGTIPNDDLPQYYQIADVYLFPTLCDEGFGMSLIEALHCGCFCIASALGGVPEVLEYGKYGHLIKEHNDVDEWLSAIKLYLNDELKSDTIPQKLYSADQWNINMNQIISQAKKKLESE